MDNIEQQMNILGIKSIQTYTERGFLIHVNFCYKTDKIYTIEIDKNSSQYEITKEIEKYLATEVEKFYEKRNSLINNILNDE